MSVYSDLVKEIKKTVEEEGYSIPIVVGTFRTVPKKLEKRLNKLEIGYDTQKSPEDLKRRVKNHQL